MNGLHEHHDTGWTPVPQQSGELLTTWGTLALGTAKVLAADVGYTVVKGLVFAFDFLAALQGLLNWEEVRWDPEDEDVRGRSPGLDHFHDGAYARFRAARLAVHRRRSLRQEALSLPLTQDAPPPPPDADQAQPLRRR